MGPELKNCPFCGEHMWIFARPSRYEIKGHKDDCVLVTADADMYFWTDEWAEEEVIEAWNTRCSEIPNSSDSFRTALGKDDMMKDLKWHVLSDDLETHPKRPPDRQDEQGRWWFTTDEDFIITDDKGRVYVAFYVWQNKKFYWKDTDHLVNAVAWMPMPEAYEKEDTT